MPEPPPEQRVVGRFEGWALLQGPLELLRHSERVPLQEMPLRILELLLSRPGQLVTREELVTRLWQKAVVDYDAGLNTAMRKLRSALGDDPDQPQFIETVPRQGYRFIGKLAPRPVQNSPIEIAEAPDSGLGRAIPSEPPIASEPTVSLPPRGRRLVAAVVIALAVVAMAATLVWRSGGTTRDTSAKIRTSSYRLAVLPFENLSPDPENAFFADGMHEEILSTLTNRTPRLEVISRATVMSYRTGPKPMKDLARDLGVTHVLEGTVRRDHEQVRITVTLSDAVEDRRLWAHSFDSELGRAMTLQSLVAAEVADRLAVKFSADRLPPSRSLEAYELWMKGVLAWQNIGSAAGASPAEIRRVEAMFSKAIELDPEYAAAYADRARVGLYEFAGGYDTSEASIASIRADLAEARRLAGNAPRVLVREATLANLVDWDVDSALALIAQAENSGPLTADFLMSKANFLRSAGRLDESLATHAKAAQLDAGNPAIVRFWVSNLFSARRPGEALQVAADFDRRFPGRIERGEPLFAFAASTARWRSEVDLLRETDPAATLSIEYDLLRYQGRMGELADLLERAGDSTFRQHSAYGQIIGLPPKPVAELRGWYRLLSQDEAAAAKEGAALREFVKTATPTQWNSWWVHLLTAEAAIFSGDKVQAAAQARTALELANRIPSIGVLIYAKVTAARVLAWSGVESEAISLLQELSDQQFSLGPAAITRDPLFSRKLKQQPGYAALERRLEVEIERNQALLSGSRSLHGLR